MSTEIKKISVVDGAKASGFEFVRLGKSGLKVSPLALGCMSYGSNETERWKWTLDYQQSLPFFKRALELGINFFDTANVYSFGCSEEITGKCLNQLAHRDEIVVATKTHFPWGLGPNQGGLSRKAIFKSVDDSLRRLNMDYIDLLQIHRWDEGCSVEETMRALHDIVQSGKVRYIGASSMPCWIFQRCQTVAENKGWTKFISMQNHYNLLYREEEREMIPFCKFDGVALIPWSPLARGVLARPLQAENTLRGDTDVFQKHLYNKDDDGKVISKNAEIASKLGVSPAQVAIAWQFAKGIDAPIIGATKMHHLEEAVAALKLKLSAEDVAELDSNYRAHPILGTSPSPAAVKQQQQAMSASK